MAALEGHGGLNLRVVNQGGAVPVLDFAHSLRPEESSTFHRVQRRLLPHLRRLSWLLLLFGALQILDLVSTLLLLSIGGTEVNPIAAWTLRQGVPAFVALKLGLAAVLVLFVPFVERERSSTRVPTWTCAGLDVLFALVVGSNLLQFALFA